MTDPYSYQGFLRQISSEPVTPHRLSANQDVMIGRDPVTCQIVLDSHLYGGVSRCHAVIRPLQSPTGRPEQLMWQVCDLESANGTYVNGKPLQGCQALQAGDRIILSRNGPEFVLEYHPLMPVGLPIPTSPNPVETGLTLSQLLPIMSARPDLAQKAYLVPGVVTVVFVILSFALMSDSMGFRILLALYLGIVAYYFIYQLCGKRKPWWVMLICALMIGLLLLSPVLNLFIWVFRDLLPGTAQPGANFITQFIGHFFGAGLMEELFKVLPVLGLYLLGRHLKSPWRERVGVWEPLDGILLAAAAALGFTWMETLLQYVPQIQTVAELAGKGAGELVGAQLIIPRVLGSVAGHMAYSGYFGYFIGLSVLKPAKRWQILAVGWLTSATIHALWNASAGTFGSFGLAFVGVISYAFLTAAILKARELSPTRSQNFATRITVPSHRKH
jgi:RsiW-degrading membrane proteinase PrsW (M82 family)